MKLSRTDAWLILLMLVVVSVAVAYSLVGNWALVLFAIEVLGLSLASFTQVPEDERWVIEIFGNYACTLEPGLNLLAPGIEKMRDNPSTREQTIKMDSEKDLILTYTKDGILLTLATILQYKLNDKDPKAPYWATYGVEAEGGDREFALRELARSTLRSIVGQKDLKEVLDGQEQINMDVQKAMNEAILLWGYTVTRHQILEPILPKNVREAIEAKRVAQEQGEGRVATAEANKRAQIEQAEGEKQAAIKAAEAQMEQQRLDARGEAEGIRLRGEILKTDEGKAAAEYNLQEQRIAALREIAKEATTVVITPELANIAGLGVAGKKLFEVLGSKN